MGASAWALGPVRVEATAAYIGALGGLLADLGYDIFSVSSVPDLKDRPSFVGWVGGEETDVERDYLVSLDAPGLVIGDVPDGLDIWGRVEPHDQPTSIDFIGAALHEIRRLTEGDEVPGTVGQDGVASTVSSTVRAGTGQNGMGRAGYGGSRNPSSRARSGTGWDRMNS